MKPSLTECASTVLIACFLCFAPLDSANRIAIKAVASEEYVKGRAANSSMKVQTYQFMKGNFHPGGIMDSSMDNVSFEEVVRNMALQLRKQNYFPLAEPGQSDLLFVVHYGRTMVEASYEELQGYTSLEDQGYSDTVANAGAGGAQLMPQEMNAIADFGFNMATRDIGVEGDSRSAYYRARLLGMDEAFVGNNVSPREEMLLKHLLDQERYFIVLVAYDWPALQAGEVKPLWTTRYSIRAIGQSFGDAIEDLNFVAGDYFGKNIKGLNQKLVTDKSRVEIGEIEVLGTEEADTDQTN